MKNIFKITIPFYISFIIAILIGKFKIFIFLMLIVSFHELGHILMGLIFKWKIEKVLILPMGSLTIFNTSINNSIIKELMVTLSGVLFQSFLFFIIKDPFYMKYNLYLLIFNLLPIYPLDGYKLVSLFLYMIFPYKLVNKVGVISSFILLFLFLIIRPTSMYIYIIFIVFMIQIINHYNDLNYIFNKFLFERYLYKIAYNKKRCIEGSKLSKMYKYRTHLFFVRNKIVEEQEMLSNLFDK